MSKLLTVFGATGQQGGSLIAYALQNPQLNKMYNLRGVTRDTSKETARALRDRDVEVVQADLNDPASVLQAIAGSYAVFGVTNFWEQALPEVEIAQGKAIADACVESGVELLIWSSLPSVTRNTNGRVTNVKHFDSKATVEEYIRTLPILSAFFMAGWYMQNHLQAMPPRLKKDGSVTFTQTWKPTALVPMIDITDTGKFIAPILLEPEKYHGKNFTAATALYTPIELAEELSEVTGKQVTYEQVDMKIAGANLPKNMQEDLKGNLGDNDEWSYFGPTEKENLKWTLGQMFEKPGTWEEFLKRHAPWFGEA